MPSDYSMPTTDFLNRVTRDTNNVTTFNPDKAPSGRRLGGMKRKFKKWYKRLWHHNEGHSNGQWRNQRVTTQKGNSQLMDAVATQLDLNTRQKETAENYMNRIDCQRYSNVGGLEAVAFCLCQIVCKEDEDCRERYYHPQARADKNDRLFSKLFNDFGFGSQQTANTIQKLRYDLDL